jgi:hypothetical protein
MASALVSGPLVATMELYSDILSHPKDIVYVQTSGGSLGHYAVKIVGYKEVNSVAYWIVMLPFDTLVGDKGIVWVRAGLNIGNIETTAIQIKIAKPADLAVMPTPPPPTSA